jgi:branched-chain amino acid transport system permease protein
MTGSLKKMKAETALIAVCAADLIAFAALKVSPGFFAGIVGILALVMTGYLPVKLQAKLGSLAALTLVFTLGFASKASGDIFFIGLIGILVVLIRTDRAPVWTKVLIGAAILLASIPFAGFKDTFLFELAIQIGIFAAMAMGLNVVVGMAGLLDMGYTAFFAIGAYTWGIFGSPQAHSFMAGHFPLNGNLMFLFMGLAVLATALTGIIIGLPALRLRGDYLAIVTLGLGEVIRVLANNMDHPVNITNGPQGITPVSRPDIGWFRSALSAIGVPLDARTDYQLFFYFLVLIVIGVVIVVNVNLGKSKFGRAWVAIREDEIAARSMGIPMIKTKLYAFATGAAFSGAMGVIFAAQRTFVSPETFTMLQSTTILGMVVLGGMGSIEGAILGAASLTILNIDLLKGFSEYLNELKQGGTVIFGYHLSNLPSQLDPAKYERLVFGLVIIFMMIFRPTGLLPERRRKAEEAEDDDDIPEIIETGKGGQS